MSQDLRAKVSYLKGLAEGLALDEESKEGKLLLRIVDLLDGMAHEIEDLKTLYDELLEYNEALDEDLAELEDDFYVEEDDDDANEDDDVYESFTVECPNCGEMVEVGEELLYTDGPVKVTCPRCGEIVMIDDEDWADEELDELLEDVDDADKGGEEKE